MGGRVLTLPNNMPYNVHMNEIRFEWDESKSRKNKRKHGVSFDEAQTVFLDENAIRYYDPDHSEDEDRFIMLGMSFKLRVLVVCHCYRLDDKVIRIVSARKANNKEAGVYPVRKPQHLCLACGNRKHQLLIEGGKALPFHTGFTGGDAMRAHYDFSKMKGEKNPYIKHLKQPVTIRLDKASVTYFKNLATKLGMPYQNLINLYLRDCAINQRKLSLKWAS
jgi:uncharacterized DUF497 family protein/uncharacterized protein (DUF4415 family)